MKVKTRNFPRSAALAGAVLLVAGVAVCPSVHAQGKPALRITAPADGTVVHPGQSVGVTVAPEPGVKPTLVWLIAFRPLRVSGCASQPCYHFKVSVPGNIPAAGLYRLTAVTSGGPDQIVGSMPVSLDVEPSAKITSLKVENPVIVFQRSGDMIPLEVTGTFADGKAMDITRSTRTTYTSSDTNVARVSPEGVVTAVGTGCGPGGACVGVGMIYVKYGGKWVAVQVSTSALKHAAPPRTTADSPAANALGAVRQQHVSLRITSPASGTIVHPGDRVNVRVVVPRNGVRADAVYLLVQGPLDVTPSRPIMKPPYEFVVSAPAGADLAGLYPVFASGAAGKSVIASAATFLDVEPVGPITRLEVHPTSVRFFDLGSEQDLRATVKLADGTWMNVTQSSAVRYLGVDPKLATVSNAGLVPYTMNGKTGMTVSDGGRVKSLAYGQTEIVVTFRDKRVVVPVTVCPVGESCSSPGHAPSRGRAHP